MRLLPPFALALGLSAAQVLGQDIHVPKPSPGLKPDHAEGKTRYQRLCAGCHGADLRGTKQGPPLVHRIYEPSHHSDIAFQIAVKYGTRQHHWTFGDMKPVAGLTPDHVAHITAFVRAEQRKAGIGLERSSPHR